MANLSQIKLLLWKNWLITRRKWILTLAEVLLPCFFMILLMGIRTIISADKYSNITTWPTCNITNSPSGSKQIEVSFSPNNSFTRQIMNQISKDYPIIYKGFQTEEEMVSYSLGTHISGKYIGGIVFVANSSVSSNDWTFKIRLKATNESQARFFRSETWYTDRMFPLFQVQGPRKKNAPCGASPDYYERGFYTLQFALMKSLLEYLEPKSVDFFNQTEIALQRHPYPPFNDDRMVMVLQNQFPFILIISFELLALNIVKDIVEEKEKRLKEAMKMMGMSNWIHWFAWFIKYLCFTLVTTCIMTVLLCVPVGAKGSVLGFTNPLILLLFLMIYSLATISFCFMLSTFFSRANSGAAASGVIFFLMYIPYMFISPRYDSLSLNAKIATCIISNVALSYGGQVLGMLEGQGAGAQWNNIASGSSIDDPFAMVHIMVMLLVDAVLYAILTWYIEVVFPGQYGIPLPWYFPFTKSYWCGTVPQKYSNEIQPGVEQDSEFFEKEPINLKAGVQINCMRKEFFGGKKVAVAGITINMFEGQITALLGHNGAGKTTTISMLTGFIPPTSGTAYVNGFDICKDIRSVRDSLGICPQYDILFEKLTVEEHLKFFAMLKGFPSEGINEECDKMLESIGLTEKRNSLSGELSGGMKRKLSLGMALIGGSKIVILDEPSSGLDPNARRQIWSVIQNNRAGRTMLLTTHFMDEADILGDRIAIMSEGVLRCCGSTLFLKSKYGAGYHLVIVKKPQCNVWAIDNFLKMYIPQAKIENNVGSELSYLLPHDSSSQFQTLFNHIELKQNEFGISSYGVTVTTMEEVFLRVSENQMEDKIVSVSSNSSSHSTPVSHHSASFLNSHSSTVFLNKVSPLDMHRMYMNTGITLMFQQFLVLLWKKVLYNWRNKVLTLGQMLVPVVFTILSAVVVKTFPANEIFPSLVLEPIKFGKNFIPYSLPLQSTNETLKIGEMFASQFPGSVVVFEDINKMPDYKANPNIQEYLGSVGTQDLPYYNKYYQVAADFGYQLQNTFLSYFNAQSYHSGAISLGVLASALLKFFNGNNSSLVFINHPLPKSNSEKINDQMNGSSTAFTLSIILVFGISFLAGSFSIPLIKERTMKAKHLQYVSGVTTLNYWMATYIWDIIFALIPCVLILAVFNGFDIEGYSGEKHTGNLFLLFIMYCVSVLPMTYLMSFLFRAPASGLVWLTLYNILAGVATMLVVTILSIPSVDLEDVAKLLTWIFMAIFPQFCLGQGLTDYYSNYQAITACAPITKICQFIPKNVTLARCCSDKCGDNCLPINSDYLGWKADGIGRMLVFMAIQAVVYFSLLLVLESATMRRLHYYLTNSSSKNVSLTGVDNEAMSGMITTTDDDVENEHYRVTKTPIPYLVKSDLVILSDVVKRYGNFTAVDRIGVGIPRGECFGLLGINGAGKTTTFKMLTGDEMITAGSIYLNRLNVKNNMRKIQREIGYCPQFDALIESMTAREILTMFAHLRGVRSKQTKQTVDELLRSLMLEQYADRTVETYSGGNKRKLSTAVALVGNPPLVLLDEPTTGMDPGTRRKLWNTLINIRDSGRTLILTSHSMDECEALCTRIAIMVNGQFRCLGSTQHLKSKFGEGYTLVAKMRFPENPNTKLDMNPLIRFIEEKFPGCILKDLHEGVVHYQIRKDNSTSWSNLFGTLEQVKKTFNLEAYSLGQTSLEQVFINFARSQRPAKELETKSWKTCCRCK